MQAISVIYKYGHFYDKNTNKRIIVKDETELVLILSTNSAMLNMDPLNLPQPIRSNQEQEDTIKKLKGFKRLKNILAKGSKLNFKVSSAIVTSDKPRKYVVEFQLTLLEDLYIYETSSISLSQTYCVIDNIIQGSLLFFEPLYAYSLNEAYHKTFVHFFNKYGHATANAFTKFTLPDGSPLKSLKAF